MEIFCLNRYIHESFLGRHIAIERERQNEKEDRAYFRSKWRLRTMTTSEQLYAILSEQIYKILEYVKDVKSRKQSSSSIIVWQLFASLFTSYYPKFRTKSKHTHTHNFSFVWKRWNGVMLTLITSMKHTFYSILYRSEGHQTRKILTCLVRSIRIYVCYALRSKSSDSIQLQPLIFELVQTFQICIL